MEEFYIHQIGAVDNLETYKRLQKILKIGSLYSRKKMDELGIDYSSLKPAFSLDIKEGEEYKYYTEDIHYDIVSMIDPSNRFLKNAINKKIEFDCFNPNFIAFAISKDITPFLVKKEEMHGGAIGEVQMKECVNKDFIKGLILPLEDNHSRENMVLLEKVQQLCVECNFELPIYNYEGKCLQNANKKVVSRR